MTVRVKGKDKDKDKEAAADKTVRLDKAVLAEKVSDVVVRPAVVGPVIASPAVRTSPVILQRSFIAPEQRPEVGPPASPAAPAPPTPPAPPAGAGKTKSKSKKVADRPLLVLADERDVAAQAFVARHRAAGARLLKPSGSLAPGLVPSRRRSGRRRRRGGRPCHPRLGAARRHNAARRHRAGATAARGRGRPRLRGERDERLLGRLAVGAGLPGDEPPLRSLPLGAGVAHGTMGPAGDRTRHPVAPVRRALRPGLPMPAPLPPDEAWVRLDVVGRAVIGHGHPRLRAHALRLAEGAGMALLGVLFDAQDGNARFVGADRWPDLSDRSIGDAVMDCLP